MVVERLAGRDVGHGLRNLVNCADLRSIEPSDCISFQPGHRGRMIVVDDRGRPGLCRRLMQFLRRSDGAVDKSVGSRIGQRFRNRASELMDAAVRLGAVDVKNAGFARYYFFHLWNSYDFNFMKW